MKSKFKLEPWPEGYCDILIAGQKVRNMFKADTDNVALKVPNWVTQDMVEKVPHDPRVKLAPCGVDKYFQLERPPLEVTQGVTFGQSVEVEVVRNAKVREDDRNQVPADSVNGRIEQAEQDRKRCDKDDGPGRRSSKLRKESGGK